MSRFKELEKLIKEEKEEMYSLHTNAVTAQWRLEAQVKSTNTKVAESLGKEIKGIIGKDHYYLDVPIESYEHPFDELVMEMCEEGQNVEVGTPFVRISDEGKVAFFFETTDGDKKGQVVSGEDYISAVGTLTGILNELMATPHEIKEIRTGVVGISPLAKANIPTTQP